MSKIYIDESSDAEIVCAAIKNIGIEGATAAQLTRQLNMEKREVNKALYDLQRSAMVYSSDDIPPRWFMTMEADKPDADVMADAIIDDVSREKSMREDHKSFDDVIPAKKIIDWKNANPVTIINEYCQITKRYWSFRIESVGPSNSPTFYACVDIDGRVFDKADGKTKRDAKNNAAKLAVDKLLGYVIIRF
ncbi:interferon resistance, PKR inhibitor [Akhmeta virus]|uniref:DsRNA-binding protein n=1 Tax=Orthopoxvirus akhmetapox TaxID=2200830 RepID=A0A346FSP6_9POXV|nr:Interferon resistance, PKR inhibitor [Akhmeta virus]AXN74850.1 Interferon resistance, PKR inhibitor [Akhmeta virus]AXN75070.1 interferon resistance, PKR inhibitor [Akhmeta virus]AXN75289.1 interferon resistance, PKR inhibitor [Akhmeta virus]QEQ49401.1 dsRNA-binding protein [Akhmeta virus]QEQ49614.1 dsRNA-binding protein [Akhmeta virus]